MDKQQTMGNIQWFPGHMTKTRRKMQASLPLVDMVVEILDARIPVSSRNPDFDTLIAGKPRVVVLNKADIADEAATAAWIRAMAGKGAAALGMDCKSGRGVKAFPALVRQVLAERLAQWKEKGMVNRPIRMMVAGIPNSGKSSFINRMARGGKAKVEDRPGVTRGNQWYTTPEGFQLLDTPGVLWPKFEDQTVAQHLAYTGAIRDEVLDSEELACGLLAILGAQYPDLLRERYKLSGELEEDSWELLQQIGRKRGMLIAGGEVNTERAAIMLLDEFRAGKLGRITLEHP
ncbi:MAG TPA: ribosome biogenesis GTPase YlqF [Firmicutes bacterium]|nr:ribosome biogenesis GTPase YlqF [Bacillota bacterium]